MGGRQRDARPGEINGDAFDRFTLVHGFAGYLTGRLFNRSIPVALALAIGWELVENDLKDAFPAHFPNATHDSVDNAVIDVVAYVAGCELGRRHRKSNADGVPVVNVMRKLKGAVY